jgi:hypothetical protein
MLTSFETFDALAGSTRTVDEVMETLGKLADQAIGFRPRRG